MESLRYMLRTQGAARLAAAVDEEGSGLHSAAVLGNHRAMDLLLRAGASLLLVDAKGRTPLLAAIDAAQTESAARLLQAKAKPEVRDAAGRTAVPASS